MDPVGQDVTTDVIDVPVQAPAGPQAGVATMPELPQEADVEAVPPADSIQVENNVPLDVGVGQSASEVTLPPPIMEQVAPLPIVTPEVANSIASTPEIDKLNAGQLIDQNEILAQAATTPAPAQEVLSGESVAHPVQVPAEPIPAPTPKAPASELELGTIAGQVAAGVDLTSAPEEKVPGIIAGNDMKVVQQMETSSGSQENATSGPPVQHEKHPLHDLYEDLQRQAENSQLVLDQEMAAERDNLNLAEIKDEAIGWQITGRVTNILMVISWALSLVSLFFPLLFKNTSKHSQGLSADLILFIVTIMVLLTCTILSFWIKSHPVIKIVTWCLFVVFVVIFILISLSTGDIIKGSLPILNGFSNRFSL